MRRAVLTLSMLAATAAAQAACPAPAAAVAPPARNLTERFVPADCATCWQQRGPDPKGLVLDWIVPAAADAALAAAAVPEAAARPGSGAVRLRSLRQAQAYSLKVNDGLPLQGYIGVSLTVGTTLAKPPPGLKGYIALVEKLAAGEEGSDGARVLVRSLIGPLALADLTRRTPSTHRLATRAPDTPRPDRFSSVGWVESAKGEVLAAVAATAPVAPVAPVPPGCKA